MAKRTISKIKTLIASVLCLIVGVFGGFAFHTYQTLPDSYIIPKKVQGSQTGSVVGSINTDIVNDSDLSIHFIELGNKYTGDCTLIKVGNTEMLIDAGSKESSIPAIKSYLDTYVTDGALEYVVVTHAHQDHYAGFASYDENGSIFDYYTIGTIIEFAQTYKEATSGIHKRYEEQKADAVADYGTSVFTALQCYRNNGHISNGRVAERYFELGEDTGVFCEILYHKFYESENKAEAHSENNFSVCLQIIQGEKKYLFTGDLEAEGESSLVDENTSSLSKVELYKAGHHGSKTSTSTKLLSIINPEVICVCCCAGSSEYTTKNENQFPTQEFINRVYANNPSTRVYVTTLCIDYKTAKFESFNGNIVLCSSGTTNTDVDVYCSNNGLELRDTDWFKANRTLTI